MQLKNLSLNIPQKAAAVLRRTACGVAGVTGLLLLGLTFAAQGATLRLMPLGDSITSGYLSSDNNGYRGTLFNDVVGAGNQTDFVGSLRDGSAFDPDHEGHSGYRIDQVAALLNGVLATYQPNLVTLHIGTNDMLQSYELSTAPNRLASMIDQIFANDPGVTIVVAQLIPNANATVQSNINAYNSQIPGIVQTRASAGRHILMVSMNTLTTSDLNDGTHPNDGGYQKMAAVWYAGVQQVISNGWVTSFPWAGVYEIQCVSSGQVLDVTGGSTANDAAVIQYDYDDGRNQLWNFIPTSNGYYQIFNANSALDLNVTGASTANKALIIQYQFGTQGNDQWLPVGQPDGSTAFYNRNSGLVLDLPSFSTSEKTQFEQYQANGGSNQHFTCIPR